MNRLWLNKTIYCNSEWPVFVSQRLSKHSLGFLSQPIQPIKPRHTHTKSCRKQSLCKKIDQQSTWLAMVTKEKLAIQTGMGNFPLTIYIYMFDRNKLIMTVGFSPDHWCCLQCSQNVLWVICPHTSNKTDQPNLVWSRLSRRLVVILKCYAYIQHHYEQTLKSRVETQKPCKLVKVSCTYTIRPVALWPESHVREVSKQTLPCEWAISHSRSGFFRSVFAQGPPHLIALQATGTILVMGPANIMITIAIMILVMFSITFLIFTIINIIINNIINIIINTLNIIITTAPFISRLPWSGNHRSPTAWPVGCCVRVGVIWRPHLMEEIWRSPVEVGNLSHYLHGF